MARAAERRRDTELRKIEAALTRLDSGDYGWCVKCGAEIAAERLRLDPAVPICFDCAKGASGA
jgi:DnaK suppressor protein